MKRYRFGLPKKLAFGDLFRQKLKKCLRPGAQTPRPPGKAGRYESTLEGFGPPNLRERVCQEPEA